MHESVSPFIPTTLPDISEIDYVPTFFNPSSVSQPITTNPNSSFKILVSVFDSDLHPSPISETFVSGIHVPIPQSVSHSPFVFEIDPSISVFFFLS